jgi:hypothetical protein
MAGAAIRCSAPAPGSPFNSVKKPLLVVLVLAFFALHQDLWFWRTARPLVFGFVPIGLFYQACYSVGASIVLAILVRFAWPGHLEDEVSHTPKPEDR